MDDRKRLGKTFDTVSECYHRARPDYPPELYTDLLEVTALLQGSKLLEIGSGTGVATAPLAQRGFDITCVESGSALAAVARANLADYAVRVENAAFEDWVPAEQPYDLVYAATAWHWIDPARRYERVAELIRPGGFFAFWSATHVFPVGGDSFFIEIQDVYDQIGEGVPGDMSWPEPGQLPEYSDEIQSSGLFDVVFMKQFDWQTTHDAESYVDLLKTFSGHIELEGWKQKYLFDVIRARINARKVPEVRRHWGCVLHVAKKGT